MTRGSATAIGNSSSRGPMPPVSKKMCACGAWMRLATVAASIATPVPAKSTSPSLMKRPAAMAIISRGL